MLKNKRAWWICGLAAGILALVAVTLPTGSQADHHEPMKANHFKCYQVLDWGEYELSRVELKDQFGTSVARVLEPRLLCNPVDKNGEGIVNKESHLVCYEIQDDPQGQTPRVKEVMVRNQLQEGPLWVGSGTVLCVPSHKSYKPRG